MIQTVVFDVGNVLYRWDRRLPFVAHFADPALLDYFLDTVIALEWHAQHDAGRPAAEMVAERSALFPEFASLIADWFVRFNESIPGPVPGSLELAERLLKGGIPLHGITNFGADTWAGFRPTAPIFDKFRDIVVSGDEKLAKPDPAIYALAERRFGFAPQAMLFIDDSLPNVEAARARGWNAHLFVDALGLEAELREYGLL